MVSRRDSLANGARQGALVGAGVVTTAIAVATLRCGVGCENDLSSAGALAAVGLGAGVGAAAGLLVDLLRGSDVDDSSAHRQVVRIVPTESTAAVAARRQFPRGPLEARQSGVGLQRELGLQGGIGLRWRF